LKEEVGLRKIKIEILLGDPKVIKYIMGFIKKTNQLK